MNLSKDLRIGLGIFGVLTSTGLVVGFRYTHPPVSGPWTGAELILLPDNNRMARAVSPNGKYIAGTLHDSVPFIWSKEKGIQPMAELVGTENASVCGVLDDGAVYGIYPVEGEDWSKIHAFVWSPTDGLSKRFALNGKVGLNFCPNAATPDGKLFTGFLSKGKSQSVAATYDDKNGIRELPLPVDNVQSSQANVISADGKVLAGSISVNYDWNSVRWIDGKPEICNPIPKGDETSSAQVRSMSTDGSKMVVQRFMNVLLWDSGKFSTVYDTTEIYKGKIDENSTNQFGTHNYVMPPVRQTDMIISGDGNYVVSAGYKDGNLNNFQPFIWTKKDGMQFFSSLLKKAGVEIPAGFGWGDVRAMSYDGKVITGSIYSRQTVNGFYPGRTFILILK